MPPTVTLGLAPRVSKETLKAPVRLTLGMSTATLALMSPKTPVAAIVTSPVPLETTTKSRPAEPIRRPTFANVM